MKQEKRENRSTKFVIFLILITVFTLSNAASATTYRWIPSNGVTVATGISTNWGACGDTTAALPVTTLLTNAGNSSCASGRQDTVNANPALDIFFNTAYTQDTNVAGNWYYGYVIDDASGGGNVTYQLVYVYANGTKVVLSGSGIQRVPSGGAAPKNRSLSNRSGTVPAGAKLGLRVSTTGPGTMRKFYGDTADGANQPSGYFSVIEAPAGGPVPSTYNLSGYVKNQTSGSPLNGVTVQANASVPNTTSDTNGFYLFTGLSNGTYIINASLSGYIANSIIRTITGSNITNANISLTPVPPAPAYVLSGYVIDQSNGGGISGATVTTNTGNTTTTVSAGNYSFTLSNGTYLIIASATGYTGNSTSRIVNGAAVSNVNISLAPIPPSSGGKIVVATNRYVILDDWTTAASLGSGFSLPGATHTPDSWTAINTKINATALFIDNTGSPLAGRIVTFNLYMPNGTEYTAAKINATTNAYGLANFSFDMNARNYYGNWTVKASNSSFNDSTAFIYNWWGCGSSGCNGAHPSDSPSGSAAINSPYLSGRDPTTNIVSNHNTTCTNCHQSFDGNQGGNTPSDANHVNNPSDVHRNVTCDNVNCHGTISTHNTNQVIGSCYNTNCHKPSNRSDISNKSTLNTAALSLYSYRNGSEFNSTFHTPNSTVPCIICHGPMHNITKPDERQRFIRNNNTEDKHCKTCHTNYTEHNSSNITSGGVNCTLCHSDDVHDIQVFAQNGTYVDLNHNNPNPARGNCTNCHQNPTFLNTLKAQPKAGSYTGRNPPQVQKPLNHSDDPLAGQKWNNYWTTGTSGSAQYSACQFCHGKTQHDTSALGRPSQFDGNNKVSSTITNTTYWCSSCHWQGYSSGANSYNDMINVFIGLMAPPEITGHATYGANQSKPGYYNHSSLTSKDDATCQGCHGGLTSSTNITGLLHNVGQGSSGGPDCKSCHGIGGSAPKEIDINVLKNSTHKNLNGAIFDVNQACYACHGDGTAPASGHPLNYKTPKLCEDCHTGAGNYSAPLVAEHNQNGQNVITNATCNTCHDNNGMFLSNAGTNGNTTAFVHYIKDITNRSTSPYQHFGPINTSNCITCHNNATYTNNASWGSPVNISTSPKRLHTETLTSQCDLCHNSNYPGSSLGSVDFHNASVKLGDSDDCIGCHTTQQGIYPAINLTSFTKHKNVNTTDGSGNLTNNDCKTCHYNTTGMGTGYTAQIGINVYLCSDCHIQGNYSAPIIYNHRPPSIPISPGGNITTGAYCTICHNNSINTYVYSVNASVSHYGTNSSLIKPTVNQTRMPRFGFMTQSDASAYNTECTNCHNPSNPSYGNATQITVAHTSIGTCKECHVNASASDLHNGSLSLPQTFDCLACHTTYAANYNAPNITGTFMAGYGTCGFCHGGDGASGILNTGTHNLDRYRNGFTPAGPGSTDIVYLNGQISLSVSPGTQVMVTSNVSDIAGGAASRVGGAEYYIDNDPGTGKGTPMDPTDGMYDAINGNPENVNATIDTSSLSPGTHTVYVRGMDIGKQWTPTMNATLIVQALGYINGTVTNGGQAVSNVKISTTGKNTTTDPNGNYSLLVSAGNYNVTASKQPEYYGNTTSGVVVTASNTTIFNIVLFKKPTGNITGFVRNA